MDSTNVLYISVAGVNIMGNGKRLTCKYKIDEESFAVFSVFAVFARITNNFSAKYCGFML